MSESEYLLQRVATGDVTAMQACIDEYGGLVWSLARRLSAAPSDAEDAVQEVFIALWEHAARFDPDKGAEVTFVAMIARRRLIDRGRRFARQQRLVSKVRDEQDATPPPPPPVVATADEARHAREAMEELSEAQQRVLRLAIHHGYTHDQIAAITDLPLGTVKTHARRGLMRVRALLDRAREAESARAES